MLQRQLARLDEIIASPFARLAKLLEAIAPGAPLIDFSLGEPRRGVPAFVGPVLEAHLAAFGRYPPIRGIPSLRQAIAGWMGRRYPSLQGQSDPDAHILPLNGSREGLFSAIFPALARKAVKGEPAVLIPNPFYQCYGAAAAAAGIEPVFLPATADNGFLPDLDLLGEDLLARTVALYLCSPANPHGAVADAAYLRKVVALARAFDFLLFADECYSEIYGCSPPPGALETAFALDGSFSKVIVFQSLSKRSGLPGLRSGFVAGDERFIASFAQFRNVACPQVPLPVQHVSAVAWNDEDHVEEGRAFYRENFAIADSVLGARYGYRRPAGAFFLWLDMQAFGGGEEAAKTLWKECGVKVLPGAYLARTGPDGKNPGEGYIRAALVEDASKTREGLARIVATLG